MIRPLWRRVWARIETRLAPVERRLDALESRTEPGVPGDLAWSRLAPAFLNGLSSVEAFGHALRQMRADLDAARTDAAAARVAMEQDAARAHAALEEAAQARAALEEAAAQARAALEQDAEGVRGQIDALWQRIEFVRREIMFEQRHGRRTAEDASQPPRILDPARAEAMRAAPGGLRLNLGCGHIPLDGYLNVDMRDLPGVDIVAEVGNLPFGPGEVAEIGSAHLLEHFPEEALRRNLLPYWFSLLRSGGRFRAVVPDGEAMLAKVAAGDMPFADYREVLFGAQDYEGDFHFNMFTPASLAALLTEAGFRDVAVPVAGRPNGKCYEFEIVAERP